MGMIIIPKTIKEDKELPATAKLIYGELATYGTMERGPQFTTVTNEYLAELYGMKKDTVYRLLKKLKDKKYIKIEYENEGTPFKERRIYPLINVYNVRTGW